MFFTINKQVFKAIWPVCFGYIPLGLACGVLAEKVGVSALESGLMSLLIYAGSGQFITLAMMQTMSPVISIVLTNFIVNLRYLIYTAAFSVHLKGQPKHFFLYFCHQITDEVFAVSYNMFEDKDAHWTPEKAVGANILAHMSWTVSNIIGNLAGSVINVDIALASYTLTAMFIGLWAYYFYDRLLLNVGIFAGVLALVLSQFLDYKLHVVVATVIAATVGCALDYWREAKKHEP